MNFSAFRNFAGACALLTPRTLLRSLSPGSVCHVFRSSPRVFLPPNPPTSLFPVFSFFPRHVARPLCEFHKGVRRLFTLSSSFGYTASPTFSAFGMPHFFCSHIPLFPPTPPPGRCSLSFSWDFTSRLTRFLSFPFLSQLSLSFDEAALGSRDFWRTPFLSALPSPHSLMFRPLHAPCRSPPLRPVSPHRLLAF